MKIIFLNFKNNQLRSIYFLKNKLKKLLVKRQLVFFLFKKNFYKDITIEKLTILI